MKSRWPEVKEKLSLIEGWAMDGLYEKDIYKKLGISHQTFEKFKKDHVELVEALKKGKEKADYEVQNATFKLATGYTVKVKKNIKLKKAYYDERGKKVEEEYIKEVEDEQYIPPNAATQMFWLKRRTPEKWGDRTKFEESGENGVIFIPEAVLKDVENGAENIE